MDQPISKAELEAILEKYRAFYTDGRPASYIPALGLADPSITGISICLNDGDEIHAGSFCFNFTIQSISKVLALICVLSDYGMDYVSQKVGLEPTREAFNSLLLLELDNGPALFNPLSNPGAMVVTSLLRGSSEDKLQQLLNLAEKLAGRSGVIWDEEVYRSEKLTGYRNKAAVNLLKEQGTIEGDPEEVLDLYFRQCSIKLNCKDLARIACVIGLDGVDPKTGERLFPREAARNIRTIMATYGMYNQSGSFALKIGLPSKSGVAGGIMSVVPKKMGIAVYNASVNKIGNSLVGLKILEHLSRELDLSIY